MENTIFDTAFVGINNNMRPDNNGTLVLHINCNQKFTMNTVMDLLKELRSDRDVIKMLHTTNYNEECNTFKIDFAHKKFECAIMNKEKLHEIFEANN